MNAKRKGLILVFCAVLLVVASVLGTMAYLTSSDEVTNTFTVGNVAITLDEAVIGTDGKAVDKEKDRTSDDQFYNKIQPGLTYDKDPMVTVTANSEDSYVRMILTISKSAELDAIFAPDGAVMTDIFGEYDGKTWIYKGNVENTADNTRTYTFWYKEIVPTATIDTKLDSLFETVTIPGDITNAQLATIGGMTITVKAEAIQADGFGTPEEAFAALDDAQ